MGMACTQYLIGYGTARHYIFICIWIGILMMVSMAGAMNTVLSNGNHNNAITTESFSSLLTAAVAGAYQ